jgi:hypothetical protein
MNQTVYKFILTGRLDHLVRNMASLAREEKAQRRVRLFRSAMSDGQGGWVWHIPAWDDAGNKHSPGEFHAEETTNGRIVFRVDASENNKKAVDRATAEVLRELRVLGYEPQQKPIEGTSGPAIQTMPAPPMMASPALSAGKRKEKKGTGAWGQKRAEVWERIRIRGWQDLGAKVIVNKLQGEEKSRPTDERRWVPSHRLVAKIVLDGKNGEYKLRAEN